MPGRRIAGLSAILSMAAACGSVVPTAPSAPSPGSGLALTCGASTILAGDTVVCNARAGSANVSVDAVWTSSDPSTATSAGGAPHPKHISTRYVERQTSRLLALCVLRG